MASLTVRDVGKTYGAVSALSGVSIDVRDGEFVALVGPSGCGKSTLLRVIAGLEPLTSGSISIGGSVVDELPPKARNVAMVFQNYALYPHMTVAENMAFALRLRGMSRDAIAEKVEATSRMLDLGGLLARYPAQLSGGQRQRVAMGRAIVRDPSVFLFDEPLSNLDAKLRTQLRAEIKELHQRLATTTVYVTHDQVEAMTMADRIVVMHDGGVEQIGSPMELYDDPRNRFVAGFIGSPTMNVFEGEARGGGLVTRDGARIETAGPIPAPDGTAVACGIRPHEIALAREGTPARVVVVEPTGADTQVVARMGDATVVCVTRERVSLRPGDEVKLSLTPEALYFFDLETGRRLDSKDG